jgi:hypothetical protein
VVGFRGPFAAQFGRLETGVSLHHFAAVAAGGVLEIGYRVHPAITLAMTGTLLGGQSAATSDECPTGVKCRMTVTGAGIDLIVNPYADERLWLAAGVEHGWLLARREGDYEDDGGNGHTLHTRRWYNALGPRVFIGRDFTDAHVPWIRYGFAMGYMVRRVYTASGSNQIDGVDAPLAGDGGTSHTLLFIGRFHFATGLKRAGS